MECGSFDLFFVHCRSVEHNFVVNRESSGDCGTVRDEEEIEQFVSLVLDQTRVEDSSWSRVHIASAIVSFEESVSDTLIDEAVNNLGHVALSKAADGINHSWNLHLLDFLIHSRTSNTISVDYNLFRKSTFVALLVNLE